MARKTIALAEKEEVDKLKNPEFTQAEVRNNIESQESMFTILGKIKKFFTDLKIHAFNDTANNLVTTESGYALDARQGKALQDKIGSKDISGVGGTLTDAISALNSNLQLVCGLFPANLVNRYNFTTERRVNYTINIKEYTKFPRCTFLIKGCYGNAWKFTYPVLTSALNGTEYGGGYKYLQFELQDGEYIKTSQGEFGNFDDLDFSLYDGDYSSFIIKGNQHDTYGCQFDMIIIPSFLTNMIALISTE